MAQNNLGQMYKNGQGVTQDYAEAMKWYLKAAEQGDAEAQRSSGSMYAQGLSIKQDYAEALNWARRQIRAMQTRSTTSV